MGSSIAAQGAHLQFDTKAFSPNERLDAWRSFYAGFTTVESLARSSSDIDAALRIWKLGPLAFGHITFSPAITKPPPGNQACDQLMLRILRRGTSKALVGDNLVQMRPGAVYLRDRRRSDFAIHDNVEVLSVIVPYDVIGYDPDRHPEQLCFAFDTPLGRILRANIESLCASLPLLMPEERLTLADAFGALLGAVVDRDLKSDIRRYHFEEARKVPLLRYLDDNLRDPTLSVARICRACGVSRTSLQRVFSEDGGVSRFILRRRLEQAFIELSQHAPERGTIAAVAEKWAFYDTAHFSRQFRARFGFRPGEVLGGGMPNQQYDANDTTVGLEASKVVPLASLITV